MQAPDPNDERILLLCLSDRLSSRRTLRGATVLAELLGRAGLNAEICRDIDEFCAAVQEGAAAGVVAERALPPAGIEKLSRTLNSQPPWSDLPILMLVEDGSGESEYSMSLVQLLGARANITILERAARPRTLLSAIRSALRARRRQYELREQLAETRRNEEKLRETAKLESLGVLAGGIAHDFNNLLVGILGNASLMMDDLPQGDPLRPLLDNVIRASERAADLTRQLLAYSGKGRFIIKPVDLPELIRELVGLMKTSVSGAVELRLDLENVPAIEADTAQLQQLVMNLVINAVEAIGNRPGVVVVRTSLCRVDKERREHLGEVHVGNYVCLEVSDSGAGMDASTQSRIFDPFFTTKFTGRGLGLSAVLGIVRGHHGAMRVDSAPGRGSTFSVLFPVAASSAPAEVAANEMHDLRGLSTVLVVDGEDCVRATAKATLVRYGYTVLEAASGQEAIECVSRAGSQVSIVLLDLTMPEMSGEETFRRMKEVRPDLRVILSSGLTEMEAEGRFEGEGLVGFLQKPYTAATLAEKVKSVVTTLAS